MGKKIQWDKMQVAENYDLGRPLDERVVIELFSKVKKHAPDFSDDALLLDAGCGTGRLTIPLARYFSDLRIVGIDTSQEMLAVLYRRCSALGISNYHALAGDLFRLNIRDDYFDGTLVSSVLHAIEDWEEVVNELIRVTGPHGYLFLISEQSAIYDLGLGRVKGDNKDLLAKFWGKYIELRSKHRLDNPEASQVGIKWQLGHPEVIQYLMKENRVAEIEEFILNWEKEFTVGVLMRIVELKCWSSMFTAEEHKYGALIRDMKAWLEEQGIPPDATCISNNTLKCEKVKIIK